MLLLSSLISLKMLSIIMIDGTKCVSDWMIHRRGPSCDQTQFSVWWKFDSKFGQRTTAGSCDDRVWSTGETVRGTGAIVFSTQVNFILPETVELNSCEDCWGRSTYVSLLTSSLMWYSVCCGESNIVLVVGAPHLQNYSANWRWIQLLDAYFKPSSQTIAAIAWDNLTVGDFNSFIIKRSYYYFINQRAAI